MRFYDGEGGAKRRPARREARAKRALRAAAAPPEAKRALRAAAPIEVAGQAKNKEPIDTVF